jgi:hypothetical protein
MRYREVLSLCDPDVLRRVIGRFDFTMVCCVQNGNE